MFFRVKKSGPRQYLQIVESLGEEGRSRQRVIANVGRLDDLAAKGDLDRLLASGARFSEQMMLLSALEGDEGQPRLETRRIGAPLLFGRLWQETGCGEVLQEFAGTGLKQMILGVVVDGEGRPACSEMWPGNTADVSVLVPLIDRLRRRFALSRACVVTDPGDGLFVLRTNARIDPFSGGPALPRPAAGGAPVPNSQGGDAYAADLPLLRCRHPRPCLLFLPRAHPAKGAAEPLRRDRRARLTALRTGDGRALPPRLAAEIGRELTRLELVLAMIKEIEAERDAIAAVTLTPDLRCAEAAPAAQADADPAAASHPEAAKIRQLTRLRGIGPEFATVLASEVFYRSFANRRQLAAYVGLDASPFASGGVSRDQGIAKAGNAKARTSMIELAWGWLRHQPDSTLSCWFRERVGALKGRPRRVAIVALARKLLIALWRYLETSLVPDGAVLKA